MKPIYSKSKIMSAALATAALGLGISMPSCPGNQAMQQQLDAVQNSQAELTRKVLALESKARTSENDIPEIRKTLESMKDTIVAQKTAIDTLNTTVTGLSQRAAAPQASRAAPKGRPAAGKKRSR